MDRALIKQAAESIVIEESARGAVYEDIVFFSFAESGAMGSPGEVLIAAKRGDSARWYCLNTETTPYEELLAIYPPLDSFDCGVLGRASGIEDGWKHIDLGFGNHLLVRDDYADAFSNAVCELRLESVGEIYASWRGIAQLLLLNYVTDAKAYELLRKISDEVDEWEYPEIFGVVSANIDTELECVCDHAFSIAQQLQESDETKLLPESVWDFLLTVYEGEINCGNADAACNLGALYYTGRAGEQDYSKAIKYYTVAADGGCRQAQENLGYCYYYGRDGEADYEKAFHYFALGAFDGHIRSLYKIGDMYRNGYYVEKNEREAFYIYCRCADTMNGDALPLVGADVMMRLGDCCFEGSGTKTDYKLALEYYQEAERLFYERLTSGDFMIKGCYKKVIDRQAQARARLIEALPDFDWVK